MIEAGAAKGDTVTTETDLEAGSTSKTAPRKSKYRMKTMTLFGVDLSPDNFAVAMVYFVQGVLGLARLAVNFFLKDDLHLDPAEVCLLNSHGFRLVGEKLWFLIIHSSFLLFSFEFYNLWSFT